MTELPNMPHIHINEKCVMPLLSEIDSLMMRANGELTPGEILTAVALYLAGHTWRSDREVSVEKGNFNLQVIKTVLDTMYQSCDDGVETLNVEVDEQMNAGMIH